MDDIARHLSMSKKTIYQFFEDKDQIVGELCRIDCDANGKMISKIAGRSKDSLDEILQSMEYLGEMLSRMNPNVIYDLQKYHPAAWNQFTAFREQQLMGTVEANLKKGIKHGVYRPDINVKILAKLRIEEVEMGMNPSIFPPSKFNIQEVQLALLEHFLYGVLTIEGLRLLNKYKSGRKLKKQKVYA
jgi:AcrR family transcriptional regulator